ncbi:MAG: carbohydrate ABC transporter permease, partial [Nitrososphaeria archaeon]
FLYSWNSYLYPLVMLSSEKNLTLPVSMGFFLSTDDAPWNIFMGVGLIYSLPPIILYYTFRRYLVSGLFRGAVKA